ncbi:hypothetical protein [Actinophytocola gossypii]|uniref:Uncharacterized protein n=1 Tax=Actinophytocola gossypii TaxID=2812003 RepID=A0ABT2JI76_9PSEU|nr:hypothetical protein [Actinophytocola gossypii]MCT2587426.1 hypothetical protein [Actinophytocola gossypii]
MHLLTTAQRDRMRHLVRRSPAFVGMRIVVHDDHVEVTQPEQLVLGYESLSAILAAAPSGQWPDLVDDYLRMVIAAGTEDRSDLEGPTEDVLPRTYARVVPTDPDVSAIASYADELVPGLQRVLAFDLPDAIAVMRDEDVARHGIDLLYDAGTQNLTTQLPDQYREKDGVYFLQGSEYVASLVLIIPWVIEAVTGMTETPHGALVALPARDQLIFHVIGPGGTEGVLAALDQVGQLVAECHAESPHQLSSRVYWWRPLPVGGLETVGHHNGAGMVTYYSDDFEDVLFDVAMDDR